MQNVAPWALTLTSLLLLAGCPAKEDSASSEDSDTASSDTGIADVDPVCTEPTDVVCEDAMILELSYHEDVSDGAVATTVDGEDFVTTIDASAGGYNQASNNPWVYIKFTPDGAEKVEISDEDSLTSMDWDLSARRFILRLNGGDSGPGCAGSMSFLESSYADVTAVPDGATYFQDDYYTDDCTIINDSSGLPGSPQVSLGGWWSYPGCVSTTGTPFLVQLSDGHVIKLVVEEYYADGGQEECNSAGSTRADGGYLKIRWKMLQ